MHWEFLLHDIPPLATGHYRHRRLAVPTRLLFGTDDFSVSPRVLAGGRSHADDLRVDMVPGVGQLILEERPELVADVTRSFFAIHRDDARLLTTAVAAGFLGSMQQGC